MKFLHLAERTYLIMFATYLYVGCLKKDFLNSDFKPNNHLTPVPVKWGIFLYLYVSL